ncbi:hypothetical protein ACKC9G_16780 [Pokkaliibacter sp. CJK22405]|uniref:hypothetical protein n=1 Tax=Pokkaliibacter sp. CJK22405 TaxID=3384615 RepID=UPI0039848B8C
MIKKYKITVFIILILSNYSYATPNNPSIKNKIIDAYVRNDLEKVIQLTKENSIHGPLTDYLNGVAYLLKENQVMSDARTSLEYIKDSAEAGNPYAMWSLGSDILCQYWGNCDEDRSEWRDKARAQWKKLAFKDNDPQAMYYYSVTTNDLFSYIPFYAADKKRELLFKSIEMGNFQALSMWFLAVKDKIADGDQETIAQAKKMLQPYVDKGNPSALIKDAFVLKSIDENKNKQKIFDLYQLAEKNGGGNLGDYLFFLEKDTNGDVLKQYEHLYAKEYTMKNNPLGLADDIANKNPEKFKGVDIEKIRRRAIDHAKWVEQKQLERSSKLQTIEDINYFPVGWSFK